MKRNNYNHKIIVVDRVNFVNSSIDFVKLVENLPYTGYVVEELSDGRQLVITKPGSKFTYGTIRREDFLIWIRNCLTDEMWLVSNSDIWGTKNNWVNSDFTQKIIEDPEFVLNLLALLKKVYNGEEPNNILVDVPFSPIGESVEFYLKFFKWYWAEEDCNYPPPMKGRAASYQAIVNAEVEVRQLIHSIHSSL